MFTCCGVIIEDYLQFECHFRLTPEHYENGCFVCVCNKFFSSFQAFKVHFTQTHAHLARGILFETQTVIRPSETAEGAEFAGSDLGADPWPNISLDIGHDRDENEENLSDFRAKFSTVEVSFIQLLNELKFNTTVTEKHLNLISSKILDFVFSHINVLDAETFSKLKKVSSSTYTQRKFSQTTLNNEKIFEVNGYNFSAYYGSIRELSKGFLSNETNLNHLVSERDRPKNSEIVSNLNDLPSVRSELEKLESHQLALYIGLQIDDFNLSHERSANTKLTLVQLNFLNINPEFQSKRSSIPLLACALRSTVDQIGLKKFFEPITEQLNNLEPISVGGYIVSLKFFCCSGDMPALDEVIFGRKQSYLSDCCIYCDAHYNDFKLNRNFQRREFEDHLFNSVQSSVFNFPFPPEPFHDLVGVIGRFFNNVLKLNRNLSTFTDSIKQLEVNHPILRRKGTLSSIKFSKTSRFGSTYVSVSSTGVQKLELLHLFPFLNNFLTVRDPEFHLFTVLQDIVTFVLSDRVYTRDLETFHELVLKFKEKFIRFFPNDSFTVKMHKLEHYSEQTKKFGPLSALNNLKNERKNQQVKRRFEGSRNFSNTAASVAAQSVIEFQPNFCDEFVANCVLFKDLEAEFSVFFPLETDQTAKILVLNSVLIQNIKIVSGSVYHFDCASSNQFPVFVKVVRIFKFCENVLIVSNKFETSEWCIQFYSYKVKPTCELIKFEAERMLTKREMFVLQNQICETDEYLVSKAKCNVPLDDFYEYKYTRLSSESF